MNEKSEQITSDLNKVIDKDSHLSIGEMIKKIIEICPKDKCEEKFTQGKHKFLLCTDSKDRKHALLLSAVTFLGGNGNHPIFKKRSQLKNWFKEAYYELTSKDYIVHFIGVYSYKANIILVDWEPTTYIKRKMNNSSAFVYINDLFQAMKNGVSSRFDLHRNYITTIRANTFYDYLSEDYRESAVKKLFRRFDEFNECFKKRKHISGKEAIIDMHKSGWPEWKQTEWPGWYLEFLFNKYLNDNSVSEIVYTGQKNKESDKLDFDLYFKIKNLKFYGDLKASDIKKKEAPGNDRDSLCQAISEYGRFWYVIYEHSTVYDKDKNKELSKWRVCYIIQQDKDGKYNCKEDSYWRRMKNKVSFTKMMILELNRANFSKQLVDFNQGHQPDGSKRKPKVSIKKINIENSMVYSYVF